MRRAPAASGPVIGRLSEQQRAHVDRVDCRQGRGRRGRVLDLGVVQAAEFGKRAVPATAQDGALTWEGSGDFLRAKHCSGGAPIFDGDEVVDDSAAARGWQPTARNKRSHAHTTLEVRVLAAS